MSSFVLPGIIETQPVDHHVISDVGVSEEEVYIALVPLNPTEAMGFDKISPKILKHCAISLHILISLSFQPVSITTPITFRVEKFTK